MHIYRYSYHLALPQNVAAGIYSIHCRYYLPYPIPRMAGQNPLYRFAKGIFPQGQPYQKSVQFASFDLALDAQAPFMLGGMRILKLHKSMVESIDTARWEAISDDAVPPEILEEARHQPRASKATDNPIQVQRSHFRWHRREVPDDTHFIWQDQFIQQAKVIHAQSIRRLVWFISLLIMFNLFLYVR